VTRAYPIYDWSHEDVWMAPKRFGWDYNTAYDLMQKAGISLHNQRCAPPFAEQPLERLWTYHVCWPELWDKMVLRVPGAATAGRYARTSLYGYGNLDDQNVKPASLTWSEFVTLKLAEFPETDRALTAKGVKKLLDDHAERTREPMPEFEPHPASGLSWMTIARLVLRGDFKGRKVIAMRATARSLRERAQKKANDAR
jgi:predicted phosphoadenosine phosphosulfate sulfurtransferase